MTLHNQLLLVFLAMLSALQGNAQSLAFSITNPTDIERKDELVILTRSDVEKIAGKITEDFHFEISLSGKKTPIQYNDVNNDFIWDELVFLASFKQREKKVGTVTKIVNSKSVAEAATVSRANVRMKPIASDSTFGESVTKADMPFQNPPTDFSRYKLPAYLTEGPGWENDKVSFRLYFDTRNTKDIYGKRIPGMVLDTIGANPAHSYHNLSGWGMDILHVVKSLGAGSLAIATQDASGNDTLIRLGGKEVQKETYEQLADGPLHAAFRMTYQWQINNKPVNVEEEISIWGGQYFYESKISITGAPKGARLVTGIADFYENEKDTFYSGNAAVLLSHGKQSENKDELGMAVMVPRRAFTSFNEAPVTASDITQTHLVAQTIDEAKPAFFRFYSCWSKTDGRFASKEFFTNFMRQEALKFSTHVVFKLK